MSLGGEDPRPGNLRVSTWQTRMLHNVDYHALARTRDDQHRGEATPRGELWGGTGFLVGYAGTSATLRVSIRLCG